MTTSRNITALYRILDDFKAQGLIDKSGKKIYIKGELK